jgi:transposase
MHAPRDRGGRGGRGQGEAGRRLIDHPAARQGLSFGATYLKTDFDGLPIAFHLTGGEVSDSTQLKTSLDIGPDITPRAPLTDKGYDSAKNCAACRERHIVPVIPYRSNAKNKPKFFPKLLYKTRARIEQAMGRLKRFKRVAMRYEKTAESYAAIVSFACTLILVKSVHRA